MPAADVPGETHAPYSNQRKQKSLFRCPIKCTCMSFKQGEQVRDNEEEAPANIDNGIIFLELGKNENKGVH